MTKRSIDRHPRFSSLASLLAQGILALGAVVFGAVADSSNGWGYGYDSLGRDLAKWRQNPSVRIDSIGSSVQGRGLWMVTVTDSTDSLRPTEGRDGPKRRIFFHARTHPAEVQAQRVANEAIGFLTDDTPEARELRRDFLFHIVPQYNPDGVELGKPRQNANGVDLESNWDKSVLEPEVRSLKTLFEGMTTGAIPPGVALNLHSDQYNCTRFFVFHQAGGTSDRYVELQKIFIQGVQARFPGGIENWNFVQSWANATGYRYPEGHWWTRRGEGTMALTYEDTNCPNASGYDSTARALVRGSADYLRNASVSIRASDRAARSLVLESGGVRFTQVVAGTSWEVRDPSGRLLAGRMLEPGETLVPWGLFPQAPVRILVVLRRGHALQRMILPLRY